MYDGDQLTAEYNGSGNLLRRYVHGPGEDDPLIWYEGSGTGDRRALHADHQGSVVAVSAGGYVVPYTYDEYGIPNPNQTARFQYTGQAWLSELGMYHYKARLYSPTLGRFLQTDPAGYADQINTYAYVQNDPSNSRDPDGEVAQFLAGALLGGGAEITLQVVSSMSKGKPFLESVENINWYKVGGSAAIASVSGGFGKTLFDAARTGKVLLTVGRLGRLETTLSKRERVASAGMSAIAVGASGAAIAARDDKPKAVTAAQKIVDRAVGLPIATAGQLIVDKVRENGRPNDTRPASDCSDNVQERRRCQ